MATVEEQIPGEADLTGIRDCISSLVVAGIQNVVVNPDATSRNSRNFSIADTGMSGILVGGVVNNVYVVALKDVDASPAVAVNYVIRNQRAASVSGQGTILSLPSIIDDDAVTDICAVDSAATLDGCGLRDLQQVHAQRDARVHGDVPNARVSRRRPDLLEVVNEVSEKTLFAEGAS